MPEEFQYATPLENVNFEDCKFYHSMDLPGIGEVSGDWDLRKTADAYLGNFDFTGKRVLDVGTASGFLTFEMEKRGADMVSFDMENAAQWDVVPYWNLRHEREETTRKHERGKQRIRNAYWYAHEKLQSSAKAYYGNDIYRIPEDLGEFDVVFFGMILSHLRDPFQALYSGTKLCTDTVIITNQASHESEPVVNFLPNPETNFPLRAWWSFSEGCLERMLEVLGFEVQYKVRQTHKCTVESHKEFPECTSIVAQRQPEG